MPYGMRGWFLWIQKSKGELSQLWLWQGRDRCWLSFQEQRAACLQDSAVNPNGLSYQIEKGLLGQWFTGGVR